MHTIKSLRRKIKLSEETLHNFYILKLLLISQDFLPVQPSAKF